MSVLTGFTLCEDLERVGLDHAKALWAQSEEGVEYIRNLVTLGVTYASMQQTNRANQLFDLALASTNVKYADVGTIASYYSQIGNLAKLEIALSKLAELSPTEPEPRYDLAALQAFRGESAPALVNLRLAMEINARRLKANPTARDLLSEARRDPRLNPIRTLPEFSNIIPPQ